MQHTLLHRPSYSALQCTLKKDETIFAESGAMLAMEATAKIEGEMKGGILGGLSRAFLTSESFFVTRITATENDTEVYLAPRAPGDLQVIELKDEEYIVQGGGFLASTDGIQTNAKFSGWKGFLSGEGLFMVKAAGTGTMFVSSFGGIFEKTLKKGQQFIVDNGHVVAFPASMRYDIQRVGSGMLSMVTTGEGLACVFEGPGTIYLQTRNLRTFAEELNPFLPARERSQGGGILGQIMGG